MAYESKDDRAVSEQQVLDLQGERVQMYKLCTEAHDDKSRCSESHPAWPDDLDTTDGATSKGLQTKVALQSGEPIEVRPAQSKQSSRSSSPAIISHMLAAGQFLGPGGVGILNSNGDHYPVFVRPIVS
jgi:hypothetical protein